MRHEISSVKRALALVIGVGLIIGVVIVVGVGSLAIQRAGDGADPADAFSATDMEALRAGVSWGADAGDLVRDVEATTRDELASAWLRANDALVRASEGDTSGLEVWFSGPALTQALDRFDADGDRVAATSPIGAIEHRMSVSFVSLDGQSFVLEIVTERPDGSGAIARTAIVILTDGVWRIRHLEQTDPPVDTTSQS